MTFILVIRTQGVVRQYIGPFPSISAACAEADTFASDIDWAWAQLDAP